MSPGQFLSAFCRFPWVSLLNCFRTPKSYCIRSRPFTIWKASILTGAVWPSEKQIASAVVLAFKLRPSLYGLVLREERDWIVALYGDAFLVEVQQRFGLPERWN